MSFIRVIVLLFSALLVNDHQVEANTTSYSSHIAADQIRCRDESGKPVDWMIAYKYPKLKDVDDRYSTGLVYSYMTSSPDHETWSTSQLPISDKQSSIMQTLAPAFADKELSVVIYNDQNADYRPLSTNSSLPRRRSNTFKAHAKGVLIFDESTGNSIWMMHSVPEFPPKLDEPLDFPKNIRQNGQTFMCLELDTKNEGSIIVDHLVKIQAIVYDSRISDTMMQKIPALRQLIKKRPKRVRGDSHITREIGTLAGTRLTLFTKTNRFGQDLYSDLVAQEMKSDLEVASWRSGAGDPVPSSCPKEAYQVKNIVDFGSQETHHTWKFTHDHSKWAISTTEDRRLFCIGDLNRMESQFKRGGGALCIESDNVWKSFNSLMKDMEPCPIRRRSRRSRKARRSSRRSICDVDD